MTVTFFLNVTDNGELTCSLLETVLTSYESAFSCRVMARNRAEHKLLRYSFAFALVVCGSNRPR
jgi:hypothetical protein